VCVCVCVRAAVPLKRKGLGEPWFPKLVEVGLVRSWIDRSRHLAHECPDKSAQFPRHGDDCFLPAKAALQEHPEAAMEPGLRFPA
jgi:hypothetical protein